MTPLRFLAIALFGGFLALAGAASAQDSGTAEDDPVVARVDGQEIRHSQIMASAQGLPPQYLAQIDQIFPLLIDRYVNQILATKAGRAAGLAEDEEVKTLVSESEDRIIGQTYMARLIAKEVTDERLQERYKTFAETSGGGEETHARHILLKTEEEAKAVIVELDDGADFAELAKTRSTGPSGPQGGDLGYFSAEQMVPEFSKTAFELEVGSYSATPTQTQFGWHVIKVEDRRAKAPPPFEEVEPQLREELAREVAQSAIDELRGTANVEVLVPAAGQTQ